MDEIILRYYYRKGESSAIEVSMQKIRLADCYAQKIPRYLKILEQADARTKEEGIIYSVRSRELQLFSKNTPEAAFELPSGMPMRKAMRLRGPIITAEDAIGLTKVLASEQHPFTVMSPSGEILGVYKRGPVMRPRSIEIRDLVNLADAAYNPECFHNSNGN